MKNGGSTRTRTAAQSADALPTVADLTSALDRLPLLAERLQDLPQPELRALFDSLQLQIAFRPQTRTIDVEVTLVADEQPDRDGETSQIWSVHLALHNTNPNPLVEGPTVVLASVHGKARRAGYQKGGRVRPKASPCPVAGPSVGNPSALGSIDR